MVTVDVAAPGNLHVSMIKRMYTLASCSYTKTMSNICLCDELIAPVTCVLYVIIWNTNRKLFLNIPKFYLENK